VVRFFKLAFSGIGTLIAAVIFSTIFFFPAWVGRLEGTFAPVISGIEMYVDQRDEISSVINGNFVVLRPRCRFHHIEWELVTPHRSIVADVKFDQGTRRHRLGQNSFGPWTVTLKKSELESRSTAQVFHTCPWRPWQTITHFYP